MRQYRLEDILRENFHNLWNIPTPPCPMSIDQQKWLWAAVHHAERVLQSYIERGTKRSQTELIWMLCLAATTPGCWVAIETDLEH